MCPRPDVPDSWNALDLDAKMEQAALESMVPKAKSCIGPIGSIRVSSRSASYHSRLKREIARPGHGFVVSLR